MCLVCRITSVQYWILPRLNTSAPPVHYDVVCTCEYAITLLKVGKGNYPGLLTFNIYLRLALHALSSSNFVSAVENWITTTYHQFKSQVFSSFIGNISPPFCFSSLGDIQMTMDWRTSGEKKTLLKRARYFRIAAVEPPPSYGHLCATAICFVPAGGPSFTHILSS